MEDSQLKPRRQFLLDVQNRDGGWGYFPGKQSWLEPTVWAALALRGTQAAERAGTLIRSWAVAEGGWRSAAEVPQVTWTSALCFTLYCANGWEDHHLHRSLARVLHTVGAEGSFLMQVHHRIYPDINDIDYGLQGWPFLAGNTSWVEPTAHTIIALRNAVSFLGPNRVPYLGVEKRVATAEQMLMERRTEDGGWNCGNRRVWGVPLPSYPETTGLALIALRGNSGFDLSASLQQRSATGARRNRRWRACGWRSRFDSTGNRMTLSRSRIPGRRRTSH